MMQSYSPPAFGDFGLGQGALPPALLRIQATDDPPTGGSIELPKLSAHMNRLQALQALCGESEASLPGFRLTIAEATLAICGLDRYFALHLASRQVTPGELRETLRWVRERFLHEQPLEDIIQALWAQLLEAQCKKRRAARGGEGHGQQ